MTRRDALQCVHEPFGDAFYFGPERLGERYMHDDAAREASGSSEKTYQDIYSSIMDEDKNEVRSYSSPPDNLVPLVRDSVQTNKLCVHSSCLK